MQDQERMTVFLFSKEARDLSISVDLTTKRDNKDRCEVQRKTHEVKYTTTKHAKDIVPKADRSKRFVNLREVETLHESNQIERISNEINESDDSENWAESRGGRSHWGKLCINQNSDPKVPSSQTDTGDQKLQRKITIHSMTSSDVEKENKLVNAKTVKKVQTTERNEKQIKKQEFRDGEQSDKAQKKNLKAYDNGNKRKNCNVYCKREVDDENGAHIIKDDSQGNRFRRRRQTDSLDNEKNKSTRLIDKKLEPKGSKTTENKVTMKYDFFLSCKRWFLKESQINICLLTVIFSMLFNGVSGTMNHTLKLGVHPTSPKIGQNLSIECKVTSNTTEYQTLVFQIVRKCAQQTRFKAICFSRDSANNKKFLVERITKTEYHCKLFEFEIADECDYRCNKGPTESSIIAIIIDSETTTEPLVVLRVVLNLQIDSETTEPLVVLRVVLNLQRDSETTEPLESKIQYVAGVMLVVVCLLICAVIYVRKQRNNTNMKAPPGSLPRHSTIHDMQDDDSRVPLSRKH